MAVKGCRSMKEKQEKSSLQNDKEQKITQWKESFSVLPEKTFFDLIRIYLGKIKTPYNKQKLIDEIGNFLCKKEVRETIIKLLDDDDVRILSVIKNLKNPDIFMLEKFFTSSIPSSKLYSLVTSLEERLVIFSVYDKESKKNLIKINPYLEDDLEPTIGLSYSIPDSEGKKLPSPKISLSPEILSAFICFIFSCPSLCKNNGELTKKAETKLKEIFPTNFNSGFFILLFRSLKNLGLIEDLNGKEVSVNFHKLEQFSCLSFESQISYLCASSWDSFSRSTILFYAKLFLSLFQFMGKKVYMRETLYELGFILKDRILEEEERSSGRISSLFLRRNKKSAGKSESSFSYDSDFIDLMIDTAAILGIMKYKAEEKTVYFSKNSFSSDFSHEKLLNIDSSFCVTVMPGFSFAELFSLIKFLSIKKYDIALTFEITKESVTRAFDEGMTKEEILGFLEKYSLHKIPQNLSVSLDEWSEAYNSATLYKGYVLKLGSDSSFYSKTILSQYICEVLSPGIFLLDFSSDEEAKTVLSKLGLSFIGKIKTVKKEDTAQSFPEIWAEKGGDFELPKILKDQEESLLKPASKKEQKEMLKVFHFHLNDMSLTSEQKEELEDRICRKVILTEEQLRPESVIHELLEASGMDFTGKLRVIENAIQNENLLEIEMSGIEEVFIGIPKTIVKKTKTPTLFFVRKNPINNSTEEDKIEIAQISKVKTIRGSASLFNLNSRRS